MHKGLIIFIVVAGICLAAVAIIFIKESAVKGVKESDRILEEFKKVDESLKQSNTVTDSANKILHDSLLKSINK
jgi:lipopolysaccharide export LptBFGC system permease protein LptF